MATKLKWNKKPGMGNWKESYECYTIFRNENLKLGEIMVFKKGEFCLPVGMFPRTKKGFCQKTKTLISAKQKVQKWFNEFIQSQS